MTRSQNATFCGTESDTVGEHIRGGSIVQCLASGFESIGWTIGASDCWRDAGYVLTIQRDTTNLQIIATPYHGTDDRWILQIAPSSVPGILARMLGRTSSGSPDELHDVATHSKRLLTVAGFYDFRWCWDDLADSEACACDPPPPPRQSV
jgi:hypothetical protein